MNFSSDTIELFLAVLDRGDWPGRVSAIGAQLARELEACRNLPAVSDTCLTKT